MSGIKTFLLKVLIPVIIVPIVILALIYLGLRNVDTKNPLINFLLNKPTEISLAGTGSMYPTLYWDEKEGGSENYDQAVKENKDRVKPGLFLHLLLPLNKLKIEVPKIGFGDIVSFQGKDLSTQNRVEYIKRVIGLPRDKIEIRDGFVIRNGTKLHEPYTYKPRSTFGGKNIPECKVVTVPENKFLVLGDNRKLSLDSRFELGFIDKNAVDFILPYSRQNNLKSTWRKIESDEFASNVVTLDYKQFVEGVNKVREELNLKTLKTSDPLLKSTEARANFILDNNNFDTKNKDGKAYLTLETEKAEYSNVLTAEYSIQGYFDANELLDLRLESRDLKTLLTEKNYEDIGVSAVNKNVNGCPTQVIVIHFGGYIPATYDDATLKSWRDSVSALTSTYDEWREARGNELYDQSKVSKLFSLFQRALEISKYILNKMENKLWLTESDNAQIEEHNRLVEEINKLSEELNSTAKSEADKIRQENYQTCINNWELYVSKKEDCKKYLE
ncbi:signal peptidase I [candidate division WWE3 bacterium RIFCSPHIGHO2_01_FULL_40_23]|uniref:Signal peptidase I n=1 Tax=candidate division WWE3 bacterium RIFCSPLOWO2_01_FULL_41_18 TaxID=1802625 RepID=A0A1F4VFP2_UNCKA|nr:MAG: signal peptidase I [candidate division WWE3 bacterium RIFCSPHIGHO2_01_FULL_40_23]OGC55770.1 MAG: signal peptidase I [candidate division WWE3 bacterium RIFCSPLOWO2_01_FULL_41_18]